MQRPRCLLLVFRVCGIALLLAALSAGPVVTASDADNPNQRKGFSPDQVYAMGDLDTVNVFNGNLIVRIPIGQEYSAGPVLRYRFMLVYNSMVWEYNSDNFAQPPTNDVDAFLFRSSLPEYRSNVGSGWTLSLGELIPPDMLLLTEWTYRGADGSQHVFHQREQNDPQKATDPDFYTEDGSYLRLKFIDEDAVVYFPDGTIHTFNKADGTLTEIKDRFGNWVRLTNEAGVLKVRDGFGDSVAREHEIHYTLPPYEEIDERYPHETRAFVSEVKLAAFDEDEVARDQTKAIYRFSYNKRLVGRAGFGERAYNKPSKCVAMTFLEKIELPDASAYEPSYHSFEPEDEAEECVPKFDDDRQQLPPEHGAMQRLDLPTGARMEWTYNVRILNETACPTSTGIPGASERGPKGKTRYVGVTERRVYESIGAPPAVWTYHQTLEPNFDSGDIPCGAKGTISGPLSDEVSIVTITAPDGVKNKHYFSVFPDGISKKGFLASEYGLPFSRAVAVGGSEAAGLQPMYLSSETINARGVPLRRNYVRYEYDVGIDSGRTKNNRVADERTEFLADDPEEDSEGEPQDPIENRPCTSVPCYVETRRSSYDGAGHYERSVTTSNRIDASTRTTFVDYTPSFTTWLLNLYGESWQSQTAGEGAIASATRTKTRLDPTTGAAEWVRSIAATGPDPALLPQSNTNDRLTVSCRDARGFIVSERYFGGKGGGPIPGEADADLYAAACSAARMTGNHFIARTPHYEGAALEKVVSQHTGAAYSTTETVDLNTGKAKIYQDAAGLKTSFRYDTSGRVTEIRPPASAWTSYRYSVVPDASVATVRQFAANAGEESEPLTENRYYYDGLGRVVQQKMSAPNGQWNTTEREYDALGRVDREGLAIFTANPDRQPGICRNYTETHYDALGRVRRVRQPDQTVATFQYVEDWQRSRTMTIRQNGVLAPATTTEDLDPFGRIVAVTEMSLPAAATTRYRYDAGDRLVDVAAGAGNTAQTRTFTYDGVGLLVGEKQPETAAASYEYDARGHMTLKTLGTEIELASLYDASERLLSVTDRKKQRVLTSFLYDTPIGRATGNLLGRLVQQSRQNCFADPSVPCISVTDTFEYEASTGRLAKKWTSVVDPSQPAGIRETEVVQEYSYTDLGQPRELKYPTDAGGSQLPARTIPLTYKNGVLTGIAGITGNPQIPDLDGITYSAGGAIESIQHALGNVAGVRDFYAPDPHDMGRTARITFGGASECSVVNAWPQDVRLDRGMTATFTVSPKRTDAIVTWYEGVSGDMSKPLSALPNDPHSLAVASVVATTDYWCRVSVPGGECSEDSPTFSAIVCQPAEILAPPVDYRGAAVPFAEGQDDEDGDSTKGEVRAAVTVTGTSFSYFWEVVRVTPGPNQSWIAGNGRGVVSPANTSSVEWVATRATGAGENESDSQYWALRVTITSHCAVSTQVSRIVKVIELLPAAADCDGDGFAAVSGNPADLEPDAPRIAYSFPPERSVSWPAGSVELELVLDRPGDRNAVARDVWMQEYVFQWTIDGEMVLQDEGASVIGISARTKPKFVIARVWRKCANGTTSPAVERSTFVWNSETCPLPPLTVDQLTINLADNGNRSFTAMSEWPSVTFQWYEGDSGNTRSPVLGDAGRSNRINVDSGADVGTYWVRATSPCGSTADSPTLTVSNGACSPVRILRQPTAHTTIAAGTSVTLSFEAVSNPAATLIEWKRSIEDEVTVVGDRSLIVDQPRKTARYWARVDSAGCDRTFTSIATVHVTSCADIVVDTPPASRSITLDESTTLAIAAHSGHGLTYQWYEGESGDESKEVSAGMSASVPVTPDATTKYWVRVTSSSGCAIDSEAVTVTVCPKPSPVQTIEHFSAFPGQQQWIGAPVSGANLSYAWYAGTVPHRTELLTTGSSYVSRPTETTQFWLEVTTSGCTTPVRVVQYRVSVCPVIVEEAKALQPNVMPGSQATLTIDATGAESIEWFEGAGTTVLHTGNTFMPTITAPTTFRARVRSGLCSYDSFVTVGLCDQPTITWTSIRDKVKAGESQTVTVRTTSSSAGSARIAFYEGVPGHPAQSRLLADDVYDSLGISTLRTMTYWARAYEPSGCYADTNGVVVQVCVPQILAQPQSSMLVKPTGSTASANLSVTIDIDDPNVANDVLYQWYIGASGDVSHPVGEATSRAYVPSPDTDTTYWVRATSSCARTIDSAAATVTVCRPPQITREPIPATAAPGVPASLSVIASGTNLTYQWYLGTRGDTSTPMTNATSASFAPTVSATTDFWVRVTGHCGSVDSATVTVSVKPLITSQPVGGPITKGTTRELSVTATGNRLTYQWYTGAGTSVTGATLNRYTPPAIVADSSFWVVIGSGTESVQSQTATFSVCPAKQVIVGTSDQTSGSAVTLSVAEAAGESYLWYRGMAGDTSAPMGGGSYVVVHPSERTNYWVRTVLPACTADSATATVPVCKPKITTQPQGATVVPNGSATLSVAATGTPPLTYQWFAGASGNTSNPVVGQIGSTLTPTGLTSTSTYWVQVSSPASAGCTSTSMNSAAATITVCMPPAITSQSSAQVIPWGYTVQLNVAATGDGLSYEWHEGQPGSGPIVGTNSGTLSVTPPGTTYYWVRVRGTCGNAYVDSSVIQVSVQPRIDQQPASGSVCSGSQATVSIAASGRELSYAWYRQYSGQAAQVVGGNQPTATFDVIADAQVWCTITSGQASKTSSSATVTALPRPASYTVSKSALSGGKWRLQANVSAADAEVVVYEWYRGALGDTTTKIISGMFRNIVDMTPPSLPTTYWVRVKYPDSGCSTDRAVTVP